MNSELDTLIKINSLLEKLDKAAITRIIQWIVGKYSLNYTSNEGQPLPNKQPTANFKPTAAHNSPTLQGYPTFADLLSISSHKTETDRFLLAAYWHTDGDVNTTFRSNDLTTLLREVGYPIKKVSNPIDTLKNKKPAQYIVQVRKNSKTKGKNGRMTLKLTAAGMKAAEDLINHETTGHQ